VAADLGRVARRSGERAYVVVGHSLGGPYALVFTSTRPATCRLVFVDASHPDQMARLRPAMGAMEKAMSMMAIAKVSRPWGPADVPDPTPAQFRVSPGAARHRGSIQPQDEGGGRRSRGMDATMAEANEATTSGSSLVVLTALGR